MANFNVIIKKFFLVIFFFLLSSPIFSIKLFYLSTDRTFSETEIKKVKVESGYIDDVDIRVYKINDTYKYFLSQEDFHRPKVTGREFRYITPDVLKGFKNSLKKDLRSWARSNMPPDSREVIIDSYSDLGTKRDEKYFRPSKQVDYIEDSNFTLVQEKKYIFENRSNNWNTNYIYFNDLKPGTYLIEGITGEQLAYTILNVSPFSFITKKSGSDVLLYSVNTNTGEPVKNISFTIYDRFRNKLANGRTDKDGIKKLNISSNDIFIFAEDKRGAYSFYDPTYYPASVNESKVYIYSNRPVYKGGDEVNIKGLIQGLTNYKSIKIDIENENGALIKDIDVSINSLGSFHTNFMLPEEAPKGTYRIVAKIDSDFYESEFKVEYYEKPEFKLTLKPEQKTYLSGNEILFNLGAEYYQGGSVKSLDVNYVISRTRYNFKEIKRDDFSSFLSQQEWEYTGIEKLSSGSVKLDDNGKAIIKFKVNKKDLKTPYIYRVMASVKNDGGSNVVSSGSTKVVSSNIRFGLDTHKFVYNKGENITLIVNATDYDRNPMEKDLKVEIYTKDGGVKQVISSTSIKTDKNGKGHLDFKATKPGLLFFDVIAKDNEGNINTNSKSVWIGEEGAAYSVSGGFVKLILDKQYYSIGETAKLLIVSPIANIPMLLTIEGTEIFSSMVTRLSENSALVEIPIKKEYLPNAFISVDFIYENRHYTNTIKLDVPPIEKFLNIEIVSESKSVIPNSSKTFKVKVTDNKGQAAKNVDLSIGVVDEAVYAISEDLTVDIRSFFYHFKRNNVMTWTSTGFRFYGYAYNVKRELASKYYKEATGIASFKGGDEDEEERKDFKDSILWIPNIATDNNGEAEFVVNFPSNITSWRFTTIGIDNDKRVGVNRFNIVSNKDVYTTISSPSIIGEHDSSTAIIKVFNDTDKSVNLTVSSNLENLSGEPINKNIYIRPQSSEVIEQEFSPINSNGGSIQVKVVSGSKLYDKVTKNIDIKEFSIDKSYIESKDLSFINNNLELTLPSDIDSGVKSFNLTVVDGFAGHIVDSLDYLSEYPHGCAEQTTNKFLPNASVVYAFSKAGLSLNTNKNKLIENINAGTETLAGYQNRDGSWGWWNNTGSNIYMTSYVLYGFSMLKQMDYNINNDVLKKGIDYLKKNVQNAPKTEKLFGLYVLGINGVRIDSIYSSININNLTEYELALYILISTEYSKNKDNAIKKLMDKSKKDGKYIYWGNKDSKDWKTNHIETTAWAIKALSTKMSNNNLLSSVNYLINNKQGNRWNSTRDTSAVIIALSDFISSKNSNSKNSYKIYLNKELVTNMDFSDGVYRNSININKNLLKDKNTLSIKGLKANTVTAITNIKYSTSSKTVLPNSNGSTITRKYFKLNEDNTLGYEGVSFNKGDNIVVELGYRQNEYNDFVMVTDNFPLGCVFNTNISNLDIQGIKSTYIESINPQNGKVYFYSSNSGNKKIYYVLTAVYPGEYSVNPALGELMYFPEVNSNSSSDNIVISRW